MDCAPEQLEDPLQHVAPQQGPDPEHQVTSFHIPKMTS
jgi:hypothetical protein